MFILIYVQKVNKIRKTFLKAKRIRDFYDTAKEKEIRTNVAARTTPLLKSVFAMQDN